MGTLLNNTLSLHHGNYLKFIPSVDQLAKTLYLIVAQLIAKAQFERALDHANDLYKFIQLLKAWKSYDSEKMDKEIQPGGLLPYKGLMGSCGQPGCVFQDFCLKQGIEFIIFCLNQGIDLSIFVLNRISFLGR